MDLLVVVPCYNEAKRLPTQQFFDYAAQNQWVSFLFVNDGSTDDTLLLLQNMHRQNGQIHFLDLEKNGGKAAAVRQGMLYAAEKFSSNYIAFWDADLATPLSEMAPMLEAMKHGNYNVVTGMRLRRLGAKVKRKNSRHYLGRVFATTASNLLNLPVYDTQCGAKIYKTAIVTTLFNESFITKWLFDIELLARYIAHLGHEDAVRKIYEYPLYSWCDVDGSRLKATDFLKAPLELLKIKRKYL